MYRDEELVHGLVSETINIQIDFTCFKSQQIKVTSNKFKLSNIKMKITDYEKIVGKDIIDELVLLSKKLKGKKA